MHKCLICIGSNHNRKENLLLAQRKLTDLFPGIHFTSEQETDPLFVKNPAKFSNQLAVFFVDQAEKEVRRNLKAIEAAAGRQPADKQQEKISLDIDLLTYDGRILKPDDLTRAYVVKGLEELKEKQL